MTVIIESVPKKFDNTTLLKNDLSYYLKLAERCICRFGFDVLVKNEDAVSFVAQKIMEGACQYDPSRGMSLTSYLNFRAICAMKVWAQKHKSQKRALSLNRTTYNTDTDRQLRLYEIIEDKQYTKNKKQEELKQTLDELVKSAQLSKRQSECIELCLDGLRPASIARKLGITREAVRQSINNAVRKIQCQT